MHGCGHQRLEGERAVGLVSEAWVPVPAFTARAVASELPGPSGDHPITCHGDAPGDPGPAEHAGRDWGAVGLSPQGFVALGTVCRSIHSLRGWEAALLLVSFRQHPVGVSR